MYAILSSTYDNILHFPHCGTLLAASAWLRKVLMQTGNRNM